MKTSTTTAVVLAAGALAVPGALAGSGHHEGFMSGRWCQVVIAELDL